ncbi:hypothetical protein ILYODFUR_026157 [Ilyodon furcidens]|uniref:Uncharacterized protein n=1 Tax=Ilyodon furcidens TaxID=33524 RepID=A0ABV0TYD5_9TELE
MSVCSVVRLPPFPLTLSLPLPFAHLFPVPPYISNSIFFQIFFSPPLILFYRFFQFPIVFVFCTSNMLTLLSFSISSVFSLAVHCMQDGYSHSSATTRLPMCSFERMTGDQQGSHWSEELLQSNAPGIREATRRDGLNAERGNVDGGRGVDSGKARRSKTGKQQGREHE